MANARTLLDSNELPGRRLGSRQWIGVPESGSRAKTACEGGRVKLLRGLPRQFSFSSSQWDRVIVALVPRAAQPIESPRRTITGRRVEDRTQVSSDCFMLARAIAGPVSMGGEQRFADIVGGVVCEVVRNDHAGQ